MPASQNKKKSKRTEQKVKVKSEPNEIYPLGHYVDDRVDLIKQTFSCLKSKYIKSICPGFLQGKSIQEIQEQCLDEILGISKKRLISIINATKCPTDTESSDEGSDVEKIVEHISLDEISSDDEIIGKTTKSVKELHNKKVKAGQKNGGANDNDKEVSVLELLELQARARAIRSQLALEPVTKIELDSDNDDESDSSSSSSKSSTLSSKRQHIQSPKTSKQKIHQNEPSSSSGLKIRNSSEKDKELQKIKNDLNQFTAGNSNSQPKPVRLKRNFRKRQTDEEDREENVVTSISEDKINNKSEIAKKAEVDRSSSPDIVTVVPSPETLCISDSDDETNTEEKLIQEKEPLKSPEPPEEGEIVEEEEDNIVKEDEQLLEKEAEKVEVNEDIGITMSNDVPTPTTEPEVHELSTEKVVEPPKIDQPIRHKTEEDREALTVDLAKEELDYEMKGDTDSEEEEEEVEEQTKIETVEINDSSNDEEQQVTNVKEDAVENPEEIRSFHERWLDSKKVSKILLTSRLGNRLRRDKIKLKKNKMESANKVEETANAEPETNITDQNIKLVDVEVGTVEHYNILISNTENENSNDKEINE